MREIDCILIGHYALSVSKQIQLAEMAFGKDSTYYSDAIEKKFVVLDKKRLTSSQLFNKFYENGSGDLSFDHVTFQHSFNTAVSNIGTYLFRRGFKVDFINTFNKGRNELPGILSDNKVNIVAITTTFYISAFPIVRIISFIKKYNSNVKIVVGGPFIRNIVDSHEDKFELIKLLKRLGADYYVYSSAGEEELGDLIEVEKGQKKIEEVPNTWYKDNDGFSFTSSKPAVAHFDQSAADWSLFEGELPEIVNLRTTKSCPFDCAFCGLPVVGGKWKQVPLDELEKEMKSLASKTPTPGIFFIDETLNFPVKRFKEMLRMMIRNKFNFKWEAELRCDTLDREAVELMKESGCQLVHLGIESGNQKVLNNMQKRVNIDDYYASMELINEFEIMTSALILIGFPGETYDTFEDTRKFIETTYPTFFRVHRWFYDHDTPVHQKRDEYKLSGGGYNWTHSTMDSSMAHELSNELSLTVKNSIHTDDYSMAFFLLNRNYPKPKVKSFLRLFDYAIKEKCRPDGSREKMESFINQMKTALN